MEGITRRKLLVSSTALTGLGMLTTPARADVPAGRDAFDYEITRTDEEWRAQLSESDYAILREGKTEAQRTSPLWNETADGTYSCKGCELIQYTSNTKIVLDKGWAFFTASEPNTQLTSQDTRADMAENPSALDISIEVHCRRCGSHIGHILPVIGRALHCVNGSSLVFNASVT